MFVYVEMAVRVNRDAIWTSGGYLGQEEAGGIKDIYPAVSSVVAGSANAGDVDVTVSVGCLACRRSKGFRGMRPPRTARIRYRVCFRFRAIARERKRRVE